MKTSSAERERLYVSVGLFLIKEENILLMRRFNTGYLDGMYGGPAGHLDGNETVTHAMIRETREEAGIQVLREDLRVVHTMHRKITDREYIDFFLTTAAWKGTPHIAEPHKCDDLRWFPINALPENTIDSVRHAIECYQNGVPFSEFGWT